MTLQHFIAANNELPLGSFGRKVAIKPIEEIERSNKKEQPSKSCP
jgi:hypothetical protein